MSNYAIINLKTDPELKKSAVKAADKLGISLSAVLNNELRRFATEQSVVFELPEVPNPKTSSQLAASKRLIEKGDFHIFSSNKEALDFLESELKWS